MSANNEKEPLASQPQEQYSRNLNSQNKDPGLQTDPDKPGKEEVPFDELSLSGDVAQKIDYWSLAHVGLFIQYFIVGICYTLTTHINYEFFTSYLGQSGNFYNVVRAAICLPWGFKIIYGALNDCVPIVGYRRKPYMVIGWVGCVVVGFILAFLPFPPSRFVHDQEEIDKGNCDIESRLKPDPDEYYVHEARKYMALLFLFDFFLVMGDVAMDGLIVQYARKEPSSTRGRAQTLMYVCRNLGAVLAAVLKGFGLNWYDYSGPWCSGIHVTHMFLMSAILSLIAIPVILFMTSEDKLIPKDPKDPNSYAHDPGFIWGKTWEFLQSSAVQQILLFQIISAILSSITSPANSMIQRYWVEVDNLTKNLIVGVAGGLLHALGLALFTRYLIGYNWNVTYGITSYIVTFMNVILTYLVIFDVTRNQYFYLSDELTTEVFLGVNHICGLLLFIEISEAHTEGISFALMTTAANASRSIGGLLSNLIGYPFSVSSADRYLNDDHEDRVMIAIQFVVVYALNLAVIFTLPLLPSGKKDTKDLKDRATRSKFKGALFVVVLTLFVLFSFVYSFFIYGMISEDI